MKKYALIVAGGSGQRMASNTPKQFLPLSGRPVLCHTLDAFHNVSSSIHLIVVLPESQIETWQALCKKHKFIVPHDIVAGGDTRTKSVKNGLQKIHGNGLVAIHDGVRPLISSEIIERSYQVAAEQDAAVVVVKLKDSVRELLNNESRATDRNLLRLVQTPQTFKVNLIKQAYETVSPEDVTDDAGVAELAGIPITLVEGDYKNIKITTPEDLIIAQALLNLH